MAILSEATFTGVDANNVRPGSVIREAFADNMAKGQAHAYEVTTGEAAPNAASITATPHNHHGSGGAPLRVPLAQGVIDANLRGTPTSVTLTTGPGWAPFVLVPVFVPSGFTEVSVVLVGEGVQIPQTVRAQFLDIGFVAVADPVLMTLLPASHYFDVQRRQVFEARCTVNEGALLFLKVEAWDGKSLPDADDDDEGPFLEAFPRIVDSWHVLPVDSAPVPVIPWEEPESEDTSTTDSINTSFTSFDAAEIQNDDGLNGYHLQEMNVNDGLLHELITGRPRGLLRTASRVYAGHNHADDGGNDLDNSGVHVDMSLGSWFFGVVRRVNTGDVTRLSDDEATSAPVWSGGIIAPIMTNHASTATGFGVECCRLPFRLPAMVRSGGVESGSRIAYAVLARKSDTTNVTVYADVGDSTFSTIDSASSSSSSSSGLVVFAGTVDCSVDGLATTTQQGQEATLRIRALAATAKGQTISVYGVAIWLEA